MPAGGVSNKPPGLQAATRHGARDPLVHSQPITGGLNLTPTGEPPTCGVKKNGPYTGPVLLRQGEPCTSQYIHLKQDGGSIHDRAISILQNVILTIGQVLPPSLIISNGYFLFETVIDKKC